MTGSLMSLRDSQRRQWALHKFLPGRPARASCARLRPAAGPRTRLV